MSALQAAKKELRGSIKAALSSLSPDEIARQTSAVVKSLFALPEYASAKSISVYLSMPNGEISTGDVVRDALQKGKDVFIPYTYKLSAPKDDQPSSVMDMVQLKSLQDWESLKPDKWGIPTPSAESISERRNTFGGKGRTEGDMRSQGAPELIIVPGMAFDQTFGRLGHGKGYYDYFFARSFASRKEHAQERTPFLVGLALTQQVLPSNETVPVDETDWPLHALLIGDGTVVRSSG